MHNLEPIRVLRFLAGQPDDVISANDIAVAFLQADGFDCADERFVPCTAHGDVVEHLLKMCGPRYGQKCASKRLCCTAAAWLCGNGFTQAKHEPCVFHNESCWCQSCPLGRWCSCEGGVL